MPKPKRTPAELPSCDMIIAAIDRAERHSHGMERGVLLATTRAAQRHLCDVPQSTPVCAAANTCQVRAGTDTSR
jgi:hypothetical protein